MPALSKAGLVSSGRDHRAALTRLETPLRGRSVTTSIPSGLPLICVDEVLIEQVFINVLENAANYTPAGGPIEISAVQRGENVVVLVRDRGPGFPHGDEERVFEKFFRGKTKGVRGAGLGLAISRAIVQRHQGRISASNGRGGGAVLMIELPIGGPPPQVQAMPESSIT